MWPRLGVVVGSRHAIGGARSPSLSTRLPSLSLFTLTSCAAAALQCTKVQYTHTHQPTPPPPCYSRPVRRVRQNALLHWHFKWASFRLLTLSDGSPPRGEIFIPGMQHCSARFPGCSVFAYIGVYASSRKCTHKRCAASNSGWPMIAGRNCLLRRGELLTFRNCEIWVSVF